MLGTNTARTYRQLTGAMTIFYGLPRFADRVRAGEFTQAHVDVVSRQCADVPFAFLPKLDIFLAARRADITCETLRRDLAKMIALLIPPVDRTELATKRRRVDVEGFKDGSACLTVSGPSAEIFACYNRIQGIALAVHGKNKSAFNLPVGVEISDDRSISQLEYDLFTRPVPELKVKVISVDPITGIQTAKEASLLDADGELIPNMDADNGLVDFAKKVDSSPADDTTESADTCHPKGQSRWTCCFRRFPLSPLARLSVPTTRMRILPDPLSISSSCACPPAAGGCRIRPPPW